jgi:antitoxin component YwqK of YwqJK toxin-antitoxin module
MLGDKKDVSSEISFDHLGRRIGLEVERLRDGRVLWRVPWVQGQMHGVAMQFDEAGRVLARSRFVKGRGVDVFLNDGEITEFHEIVNSVRHGVTRWGNPLQPWAEEHYLRGKRAGVFREWKGKRLQKGFPKYFIDDEEVSRAEYRRARRAQPELPRDFRRDDSPKRALHPALKDVWISAGV